MNYKYPPTILRDLDNFPPGAFYSALLKLGPRVLKTWEYIN